MDYIDLQYDPAAFKLPHSESQSKFNSLPNIKSGRKSRYISAIEAISLPKCEAKENLAIESSERETDNVSKLSDTTTVLIHESPRGIANDAFEDDEDVLDSNKRCNTASPSQSNVSYSSNDSSVKIPIPEISAAAKKKQMESEGYQNSMIDTKLKKNWRWRSMMKVMFVFTIFYFQRREALHFHPPWERSTPQEVHLVDDLPPPAGRSHHRGRSDRSGSHQAARPVQHEAPDHHGENGPHRTEDGLCG